jgi:hypothetical protein
MSFIDLAGHTFKKPSPATTAVAGLQPTVAPNAKLSRRDRWFYSAMSIVIACTVFVGFSRTFYLKSYFHGPALPVILYIHGIFSTLWILLFGAQNLLIAGGKLRLHRILGWAGAILALLLLPLDTVTAIDAVRRGVFAPAVDAYSALLSFNFRNIFEFAVLIALAIRWRRKAETHKRLALLATVASFADPAIGRIPGIPLIAIILLFFGFHFAGPCYDLFTRRRVHTAYLWGVPFLLVLSPFAGLTSLAARSHFWHSFVNWLLG